jgi:hypothetical protein
MVLPAVPSSVSTTMFNPQSFPPQQALLPSVALSVAPPCTVQSVPQWPPFAQALVTLLATVPAGQGNQTFPGTPSLVFFSQYPVTGTGVSIPGVRFPGHGFVAPGSSSYLPAIPPVTPKLVAAIISGEFTDFACLLETHAIADAPSFSFVADQLVIRPAKRC